MVHKPQPAECSLFPFPQNGIKFYKPSVESKVRRVPRMFKVMLVPIGSVSALLFSIYGRNGAITSPVRLQPVSMRQSHHAYSRRE